LDFSSGRVWPYAISILILMVFGFCVATIIVTQQRPVAPSHTYMANYHEVDANANELIYKRIALDKEYKIAYITDTLSQENSILKYRVTDLNDKPVNDAKIKVIITRPNSHDFNQELVDPSVENGVYTFSSVTLAKPGRWDVMAKVDVGELQRFYNVKADTRAKEAFEY